MIGIILDGFKWRKQQKEEKKAELKKFLLGRARLSFTVYLIDDTTEEGFVEFANESTEFCGRELRTKAVDDAEIWKQYRIKGVGTQGIYVGGNLIMPNLIRKIVFYDIESYEAEEAEA